MNSDPIGLARLTDLWLSTQLGAREHYAVPRSLNALGMLQGLHTDFWWREERYEQIAKLFRLPRLSQRKASDISDSAVVDFPWLFITNELISRAFQFSGDPMGYGMHLLTSKRFSKRIAKALRALPVDQMERIRGIICYTSTAQEAFKEARRNNKSCVLCQIDPGRAEVRLVESEQRRWPNWALYPVKEHHGFFERVETEWALSDLIIVNSTHSAKLLEAQGCPPTKMRIIPLAFEVNGRIGDDLTGRFISQRDYSQRPLQILFLGQVNLRKGIQYLLEAALRHISSPVCFHVVGQIQITTSAMAAFPENVFFHGPVTRHSVSQWYNKADLFVLPTISDGFAITQIEAMSHGLPVIATRNCGEVVLPGRNGLLVDARDSQQLADAIQFYLDQPDVLMEHSISAASTADSFNIGILAQNLKASLDSVN